jgi:hypothetical protein
VSNKKAESGMINMATNPAMDEGVSQRQEVHAAARIARLRDEPASVRRQRPLGAIGSVRDVVRDTVQATFDALRGRYDR